MMISKNKVAAGIFAALMVPQAQAMFAVETGFNDPKGSAEAYEFVSIWGATGNEFGDIGGYLKLSSPTDDEISATELNIVGQINIGQTDFNLYGQVYKINTNGVVAGGAIAETNNLFGFSHDTVWANGWYTQAAIAAHYVNAEYAPDATGFNGGYVYLGAAKGFELFQQNFTFDIWQEHYFGRNDEFLAASGDADDFAFNGRVSLRWHATENISTAIQYRYVDTGAGDLSETAYYTVQYDF